MYSTVQYLPGRGIRIGPSRRGGRGEPRMAHRSVSLDPLYLPAPTPAICLSECSELASLGLASVAIRSTDRKILQGRAGGPGSTPPDVLGRDAAGADTMAGLSVQGAP